MTTLQDKLNDPKAIPQLFKDVDGNWHCALTEEDLNILQRQDYTHTMYDLSDAVDYFIMKWGTEVWL